MRSAKVRRAKLYFLRDLKGKAARMKEAREATVEVQPALVHGPVTGTEFDDGPRPAMRTLENALRRVGFVHVAGVDEVGRGCLAGPVVAGRRRAASRPAHSRRLPTRRRCRPPSASGSTTQIIAHAVAWAVAVGRSARDRPHQHPSGVAARDAARRAGARAAARHRAGRRVPHAGSADGAARRRRTATAAARRSPPRRSSPR